jgi:DNA topoisomerase VI subunit A
MDNDPHGLDIYATYKWGARVHIHGRLYALNCVFTASSIGYGI